VAPPAAPAASAPAPPPKEVLTEPTYDRTRVAQPRYPVQAYRNGQQGEVLLKVLVGKDGKPKNVTVEKTSGSSLLDRAAIEAVKGWQFTPGTRNGAPREAARQVAVGFRLEDE
jgi:protein TonB